MRRKILGNLFICLSLFSCNQKPSESALQQQNIAIAKQLYTHFNAHEWEKMANLYVENAEFKDPSFGTENIRQTKKQIVEKYQTLAEMFPDIKDEIVSIYPSGDKNVIVEFVSSGTTPDKAKFVLPICTVFTLENGKIIKDCTYYDND